MAEEEYVRLKFGETAVWAVKKGQDLEFLDEAPWNDAVGTGRHLDFNEAEILAPAEPKKIICVGLNYKDHAAEMGEEIPMEPKIFMKPATAVLDPGKSIHLPAASRRVDHEAELAVVMGRRLGPGDDDPDAIFGYTCANDVTARDLQKVDGQWTRAKGFDTFCPLGPVLKRGADFTRAGIRCRVNGEIKQDSNLSNLIFTPDQIVHFVAGIMTLLPGEVILTGTPGGIGPIKAGDEVEVEIEGIGKLQNLVVD